MANQMLVYSTFIIIQILALVHGKHLRQRIGRDARLSSTDDEPIHSEEIREVRILPKSYITHIGDVIDGPTRMDKPSSEEDYEEEIMEREFLEHMSRIPLEKLQREESIESSRVAQVNGIQNMPFDVGREIFPNAPGGIQAVRPPPRRPVPGRSTVRPPAPPDGRLPNGRYTDIGRALPINDYMQSRLIPPNTAQPIPAPNPAVKVENNRFPYPVPVRPVEPIKKEEEPKDEPDLIKLLLERIRPGEKNGLGNRGRWALYFGHVFLQALNTIIDGTQVALKGGAIN